MNAFHRARILSCALTESYATTGLRDYKSFFYHSATILDVTLGGGTILLVSPTVYGSVESAVEGQVGGAIWILGRFLRLLFTGAMLLLAALVLVPGAAYGGDEQTRWVGSWAASQQLVEPNNASTREDLRDATLRQVVHLSLGGKEIRLRLSNRFGTTALHLTAVHVAKSLSPSSDKIAPGTDKAVTFTGSPEVTIPPHADYFSARSRLQ